MTRPDANVCPCCGDWPSHVIRTHRADREGRCRVDGKLFPCDAFRAVGGVTR